MEEILSRDFRRGFVWLDSGTRWIDEEVKVIIWKASIYNNIESNEETNPRKIILNTFIYLGYI